MGQGGKRKKKKKKESQRNQQMSRRKKELGMVVNAKTQQCSGTWKLGS